MSERISSTERLISAQLCKGFLVLRLRDPRKAARYLRTFLRGLTW